MTPIRVLLVDDSAIARRIIIAALKAHPEVEVAAAVPSGELALARLPEVRPDAVILDVEMPGMNGVETLKQIRKTSATLPVIMFSALTDAGALITVQALAAGASDYVCKPSTIKGTSAEQVVAEELVPKLLALCGRRSTSTLIPRKTSMAVPSIAAPLNAVPSNAAPLNADRERGDAARAGRVSGPSIEVIVLACSTGGPNALAELIPRLPASLSVPVLIVQHMPPMFTRHLAERLNSKAALRVREAQGGEHPVAGEVWIAPGDYHLELHRVEGVLTTRLNQGPRENSCRPAADVLFRSAAAVCGASALGVVLTGMGQDGLEGCRALAQAGAKVVTQDEASCVVWGMPKAVELAGLATVVCPLSGIADEISRRTARKISLGGAA